MANLYGLLADLMAAVHALLVLFVVGGQVLVVAGWARGWTWTRRVRFRATHLGGIGFVLVQTWLGQYCPLTVWENDLRRMAGEEGIGPSFLGYWLDRILFWSFPHWVFVTVYTAFGVLVLATWVFYPPRKRKFY